jgi:TetR/AcrR family transcriptional regulator, cholesterol catabolism regulator
MRAIAESVGLLPGSLYAHISSKEELLQRISEAGIDRFLAVGGELDPELPVQERMRLAIRAHVNVVAESPQRTRVVFHEWRFLSADKQQAIIRKRERYEAIFTKLIREGIEIGTFSPRLDARIAVMGVLGALNWTPEWLRADGARSADSVGEEIAEIVLRGLVR